MVADREKPQELDRLISAYTSNEGAGITNVEQGLWGSHHGELAIAAVGLARRFNGYESLDPGLTREVYDVISDQPISSGYPRIYTMFHDCTTLEEVRAKLDVMKRLSQGQPVRLESDAFPFRAFDFGERYPVDFKEGSYEAQWGFGIQLSDRSYPYAGKELMAVEGRLHTHTNVLNIQGGRHKADLVQDFKDRFGIHPANLLLLMYLRIGQILGHDRVEIAGKTDREYNRREVESTLYDIPRNYFRLRIDPETGRYRFDGATRDRILEKFLGKAPFLAEAFGKLDAYLASSR